jgi:hypothetical protein
MARQLRIQYEGAIYHLMSRRDRREEIFREAEGPVRSGSSEVMLIQNYSWILRARPAGGVGVADSRLLSDG